MSNFNKIYHKPNGLEKKIINIVNRKTVSIISSVNRMRVNHIKDELKNVGVNIKIVKL
ncbi:hypothetical protein [Staphylococcus xylosus]|mgnify:FL=1|uniref:hypothetical protein n=1 Tax=Staphylococcus xylosus TaxID=1288 RepID=UPI001304B810|nr:hypothetical protein [Staphylococcus xylosus]MCE7785419.1 hypothetical protein [Staphylococcus xylosus]MCM3518792.1 hypothetical protein [Staphylococcus xylosus]MEB8307410.1 hypothetical protein [Staphylococcus xylosus]